MESTLIERKKKIFSFLATKKNWIIYCLLALISLFSYKIRTSNLSNLIDVTTGKHLSIELDTFVILRYVKQILSQGYLNAVDMMRYYPDGYQQIGEFSVLSYFIAYLYKFFHFFNSNITLEYIDVIYPPLIFSFTLIVFFLLVRKLFDYRVALIATAYLAVIPSLLQRTVAGFSDKESLALLLFVLAFYFYTSSWKTTSFPKTLTFGILAGITTGLMGLIWGGVQFVFLILGFFGLFEFLLNKSTKHSLFTYAAWCISAFGFLMIFSGRYTFTTYLYSPPFAIAYVTLFTGFILYLLQHQPFFSHFRTKIEQHIPIGIFSFIALVIIGLLFFIIFKGPSFVFTFIADTAQQMINPFGESRWGVTVAESHQPYLRDVINELGKSYFFFFILGSILVLYQAIKHFKKYRTPIMVSYILFILIFLFSRYSPESTFNGTNLTSFLAFGGSLLLFIGGGFIFFIYVYKKDKTTYSDILSINNVYLLIFVWFILKIIAARLVVRLLLLFGFVTAILAAYFFVALFDYARRQRNLFFKYALFFVIVLLLVLPSLRGTVVSYTTYLVNSAPQVGPAYNQQWQIGMKWVRENTPPDSVFIGWWDYGYWIQGGGERASVSDGGNVGGQALNYYTARNVLTTSNDTDALAFIKAKGATHFLTLSDDIGKYPAYSSIGSDLANDRYSWISTFRLNPNNVRETRNATLYIYEGSTILDEDFIYQDKLYPERAAGIAGFMLPLTTEQNTVTFARPTAVLVTQREQVPVPLNCVVFNQRRIEFGTDGLDGCLLIIPSIDGDRVDSKGAALYLSRKVKDSLFARLYLYETEVPSFNLVYSDQDQIPLAVYNGRLFGPMKIWNVTVPPDLPVDPALTKRDLPDPRLYYVVR